jgi:hypothetical protein
MHGELTSEEFGRSTHPNGSIPMIFIPSQVKLSPSAFPVLRLARFQIIRVNISHVPFIVFQATKKLAETTHNRRTSDKRIHDTYVMCDIARDLSPSILTLLLEFNSDEEYLVRGIEIPLPSHWGLGIEAAETANAAMTATTVKRIEKQVSMSAMKSDGPWYDIRLKCCQLPPTPTM